MGIARDSRHRKGSSHRHKHFDDDLKGPPRPQKIAMVVQDGKMRPMTRAKGRELQKMGVKVTFGTLTYTSRKHQGSMLGMRTKDDSRGDSATQNRDRIRANLVTGSDSKAYKQGATRIHWKGGRDLFGNTTGLTPFITQRDGQGWSADHEKARTTLGATLMQRPGFTALDNGLTKWGAEDSHLVAGSLWGPNDALSAPAASVHQNTEWLAIEEGMKKLSKRSDTGGELRFKTTGYVPESGLDKGTLKAARFKIYIGGVKVFDHLADGQRGNIDAKEAKALKAQVEGLSSISPVVNPEHSKHFGGLTAPKGLFGSAPTLGAVKGPGGRLPSESSPMFTDARRSDGVRFTGSQAATHVNQLLK